MERRLVMDVGNVLILVKVWEEDIEGEKRQRISFLAWNKGKKNDKEFEEEARGHLFSDTKDGESVLLLKT